MYKITADFKKYNSTVKSVLLACQQAANGYHLSDQDIKALKQAIEDLNNIVGTYSK